MIQQTGLYEAVVRAIRISPHLSQRNILAELRAQGYKVANETGRAAIRLARAESRNITERTVGSLNNQRQVTTHINVPTFTNRDLVELGNVAQKTIRETVRRLDIYEFRGGEYDSRTNFSHVHISYTATVNYILYVDGIEQQRGVSINRGQYTMPLRTFNYDFIAERVSYGVEQQLKAEFRSESDTFIETGQIEVQITNLDVRLDSVEGRGGKTSRI